MIKKITTICILVGLILSASGCEKEKAVVEVKPIIRPQTVTEETVSYDETVSENEVLPEEKIKVQETEETTVSNPSQNTESVVRTEEKQIKEPEIPKEKETEEKPAESESKEKSETVNLEIVPVTPQKVNATSADSKEIAEKILGYINSYRAVPAIKLEGLTEYAEYRSRQLIKRFAHNTEDERAAATALQYGEYVDPSLYGMNGEPYYTSCSREAIAKAGYAGTVDEIAKRFADLIKNSAKHWAYVGADEYSYIAVGVTYESGMWYCDVAVTSENTDNK